MKTKEELNALKQEIEVVSKKLNELTEEELEQVTGGSVTHLCTITFDFPVLNLDIIKPDDVEQTVVLKDAASEAIYGSRGAN